MSNTAAADYTSLREKDEIRLLDLLPGSGSEPICCTLRHVKLSENPKYEALSYAWGQETDCKDIQIDSKVRLVRNNLWFALKYLRKRGVQRILWIDALCINQADDSERSHQVYQMGKIYSCATSVCVWLGLPDSSSYSAMLMLRGNQTLQEMRASLDNDRFKWHSVARLCERDYWTRLWIIQEIVLAGDINLYCGDLFIPWNMFIQRLSSFARMYRELLEDDDQQTRMRSQYPFGTRILESTPLKLHEQRSTMTGTISKTEMVSLYTLARANYKANCADTRDKIYGLHSLAPLCCQEAVPVDYTCSAYVLCGRLLEHDISSHSLLDDHKEIFGHSRELHQHLECCPPLPNESGDLTKNGTHLRNSTATIPIKGYPLYSLKEISSVVSTLCFPNGRFWLPNDLQNGLQSPYMSYVLRRSGTLEVHRAIELTGPLAFSPGTYDSLPGEYGAVWSSDISSHRTWKSGNWITISEAGNWMIDDFLDHQETMQTDQIIRAVKETPSTVIRDIYDILEMILAKPLTTDVVLFSTSSTPIEVGFAPTETREHDMILEMDGLEEILVARALPGSLNVSVIGFASFLETEKIPTRKDILNHGGEHFQSTVTFNIDVPTLQLLTCRPSRY